MSCNMMLKINNSCMGWIKLFLMSNDYCGGQKGQLTPMMINFSLGFCNYANFCEQEIWK